MPCIRTCAEPLVFATCTCEVRQPTTPSVAACVMPTVCHVTLVDLISSPACPLACFGRAAAGLAPHPAANPSTGYRAGVRYAALHGCRTLRGALVHGRCTDHGRSVPWGREVLPTGVVWWWAYRPDGLFFRRGDHGVMPLHASIPAVWFPCGCIRHGYGLAHALLAGTVDARPLCRATLYFLNAYIGVVMPTLAACCYRWPPSEPMPTGSQEAPAASWRLRLAWLVRHCSALASTVDRWLVAVAGAHYSGMWRLFVLWHTAVVCWWVSRMAAGIV